MANSVNVTLNVVPQTLRNVVCDAIKYASLYAPIGEVEDVFYTEMFGLLEQINVQCDQHPLSIQESSQVA